MTEQWLSIVEYSRAFGISDMTIRRRIRTGRIQAVLRDGKYYIPTDADPMTGELRRQSNQSHSSHSSQPTIHKHPVKSHPHAERTMHAPRTQSLPEPVSMQRDQSRPHRQTSHQPQSQVRPWTQNQNAADAAQRPTDTEVTVEARALLNYCNATLDTTRDRERLIEARFSAKIDTMMEQLKNRDMEIQRLQQQIEDLQLLVQILERKKL